ncbi:hypothetical protein AB1Y20_016913 [Prymnesium parvum]|uniref:Uncharacterized protein n=1 Tax=Prymnesium parvum TaxID=97485 RepID=A0AB34I9L0_PRYPA
MRAPILQEALRELVHSTANASERELVKASTDQQEVSSEFQKRLVEHETQQKLWEVAMEEASDVQEALKMQLREQEERSEIKLELVKARQVQLQQQLNSRTFELESLRKQQERSAEHEAQLQADLERANARVATLEELAGELVAEHESARQEWDSTEDSRAASLRDFVCRVELLELDLERADIKRLALEKELAAATAANEEQAVRLERAMAAVAEVGVARRVLVSELYTSESQAVQIGNMAERTADLVATLYEEVQERQREAAAQLELEREERALECARLLEEGRASTAEVLSATKREWEVERDRLEEEWTRLIERERTATSSLQAAMGDAERTMEAQAHSMKRELAVLLERESVLAAELEVLREQQRSSAEQVAQLHADLKRATTRVATLEAVAGDLVAEHEHARQGWDSNEKASLRDSVGRVDQLELELERADTKRLALEKELAAATAANEEQAVGLERAMAAIAEVGVARRALVSELYLSESQAVQLGNMAEQTADLVAALQNEAEQRQHEAAAQLELEREEHALVCARLLEEGKASTAEVLSATKREWEAERYRLEQEWTTQIERERAATSSLQAALADAERAMERQALEKSLEADARCSRLEAQLTDVLSQHKVLLKDVSDLEEHRAEDKRIIAAMEAAVREQANAEQEQAHSMENEFSILMERESVLAAELEVLREQQRLSAEQKAQLHADLERATARVASLEAVASLAEHEHARPAWDSNEEARLRDSVGRVDQLELELERADTKRLALEKELAAATAANEEQAVGLERAMAAIAEVGVARRALVSELYLSESQAVQLGNMAEQTADLVAALQNEAEQRQREAGAQLELEREEHALVCARLLEEGKASTAEVLSATKREWEAERYRLEQEWTTQIERERAATSSLRAAMADAERAMERQALEKSLEADARCSRLEAELKQELAHQREEYERQLNVRMLEHERGLQMLSTSSKQLQDAQVEAARLAAEHEENMNSQLLELHKAQYYSQYLEQQLEMAKSSQKDLIDRVNSLQKAEEHAALERSKALDNLREHSRRELQEALRRAKASHELLSKQQADALLSVASEEKEAALRELQVELEEKYTLELRDLEEQHTAELAAALKESKYSLLDLKSEHASTLLKCIEHEREIERLNDLLSRRSSELEHVRNDLRAKSQEWDHQLRTQVALRLEDVRTEGYAKGFARGREEGRQEGREEGKQMHAQALDALREELNQATAQVQEATEKTQLFASEQREAVAREARSAAMAEAQVALASLRSTLAKNQLQAVDAAVHRCREEMESTVTELQLELATQKESIERERRAREADRESLLRLRSALSSEREEWDREREQLNDEIKNYQRQCKEAKRAVATLQAQNPLSCPFRTQSVVASNAKLDRWPPLIQERLHGMEEQLTAHARKKDEPGDELRHASDVEDGLQSMKKECDTLRAERDFLQCKCTLLHTECEKLRTDSREASAASRRAAEQLRALAEESEILRKAQQEAEDELDSRAETSIREAQLRAEQLQVALERSETARRTLEEQLVAANAKLDRSDDAHQKDQSLLEQQLRAAAALGDARCSVLKSEMRSIENQLFNARNSVARAESLAPTLAHTVPLDLCNGDGLKRLAMETVQTSTASLSDSTAASLSQLALISQRDELAAWLQQLSDRKDAEWELVVQAHVASYDALSKQLEDVRRTASQERVQAILQVEARARAQIDAAREEANSSRADAEAARLEADAARAEAAAISRELQDALADCSQARQEVSKLEQDVATAHSEEDHVRARLKTTEATLGQLEEARRIASQERVQAILQMSRLHVLKLTLRVLKPLRSLASSKTRSPTAHKHAEKSRNWSRMSLRHTRNVTM